MRVIANTASHCTDERADGPINTFAMPECPLLPLFALITWGNTSGKGNWLFAVVLCGFSRLEGQKNQLVANSFWLDGSCAGWWSSTTIANICAALVGILGRVRQVGRIVALGLCGQEHPLQKRPAPAATCSRTVALGQLAGTARPLQTQVIRYLAAGDVETETEFIVGLHVEKKDVSGRAKENVQVPNSGPYPHLRLVML
jgi:hypothetical protein